MLQVIEKDVVSFLSDVIKDRKNYKESLKYAANEWNLSYKQLTIFYYIMEHHDMSSDSQFKKFREDLEKFI